MGSVKTNFAVDVAFEVISERADAPTAEEIFSAMEARLAYLKKNKEEAMEAFDVFDSYIID